MPPLVLLLPLALMDGEPRVALPGATSHTAFGAAKDLTLTREGIKVATDQWSDAIVQEKSQSILALTLDEGDAHWLIQFHLIA